MLEKAEYNRKKRKPKALEYVQEKNPVVIGIYSQGD